MLILTARGANAVDSGSWEICANTPMILGRNKLVDCSVAWDEQVSRRHAAVTLDGDHLVVRCLSGARNPIRMDGRAHRQVTVALGQGFQIGSTRFAVASTHPSQPSLSIMDEVPATAGNTTSILMMNSADVRLEKVSKKAASLWSANSETELAERALQILAEVLSGADLLVALSCTDAKSASRPQIIHWQKNKRGVTAAVSRRLISDVINKGETAIEVESDMYGDPIKAGRFSCCIPVKSEADVQWCIYMSGDFGPRCQYKEFLRPQDLKTDASIAEMVAHLVGAIRSVRSLENKFDGIRQFFSPSVLESISSKNSGADLAPRETDVVAIYCDLRGFSRMVSNASDDLHSLLRRISAALGIMTQSIIEHQGVIADFQGDSALGFWGWPIALTDGPISACRAALQIRRVFELAASDVDGELDGFHVGIGIATGRAIAGRIGTRDHAKIGIFGPVVNLASRLEGLTKKVGATILMDDYTAETVRAELRTDEGRCRPIGRLQPVGFDDAVSVSELLPPESESAISNQDIDNFSDAVSAFQSGDWDTCRGLLGTLPANDRPRDFLLVQIASQNYQPPSDWSGIIKINSK